MEKRKWASHYGLCPAGEHWGWKFSDQEEDKKGDKKRLVQGCVKNGCDAQLDQRGIGGDDLRMGDEHLGLYSDLHSQ